MVNLVEFFDSGRSRVPGNAPMLGRRPLISSNPPTYANYYEWITWEQADIRRQLIGSGLTKLFEDGVAGGDPLRCFGIYSGNCPGTYRREPSLRPKLITDRMAIVRPRQPCVPICLCAAVRYTGQRHRWCVLSPPFTTFDSRLYTL